MIDWEAAASGKRPLRRGDGCKCRYLGKLKGKDRYAVAVEVGFDEQVQTYTREGLSTDIVSDWEARIIQEPETIEYVRFINVYPDFLGLPCDKIDDLIPHSCIGTVKVTTTITGNKIVIHGESDG